MTPHVTASRHGHVFEVDVLTDAGSWTIRLAADAGNVGLIVVDHLLGRPVVAQLLRTTGTAAA